MPRSSNAIRSWLPAIGTAVPLIILPIAILSLPLAASQQMGLSPEQLTSWILALYALPNMLGLFLTWRYQQPLLLTGNVFVIIFIVSLQDSIGLPEIIGASIVAGVGVLMLTALGLVGRVAALIPEPIVLGLLAGAVLPFVVDVFTILDDEPIVIGGTVVAYLLGHRIASSGLPPILPALVAGFSLAVVTGKVGDIPDAIPWPVPVATMPGFSIGSIITVAPVMIILLTLQSNVPSMVFLRSQDYRPPEQEINYMSGVATAIGSLLGPTGVSLSLPATSLVAGPDAGDRNLRHRGVYLASGTVLLLSLFAGIAAELPAMLPVSLLLALAGLAVVGVLTHALRQITRGPLTLGPLFAFAISLSEISLLGLGPFFWSIVVGTGVSLWLEQDALSQLRSSVSRDRVQER